MSIDGLSSLIATGASSASARPAEASDAGGPATGGFADILQSQAEASVKRPASGRTGASPNAGAKAAAAGGRAAPAVTDETRSTRTPKKDAGGKGEARAAGETGDVEGDVGAAPVAEAMVDPSMLVPVAVPVAPPVAATADAGTEGSAGVVSGVVSGAGASPAASVAPEGRTAGSGAAARLSAYGKEAPSPAVPPVVPAYGDGSVSAGPVVAGASAPADGADSGAAAPAPAPASVSSPAAGDGAARPGEATALLNLVKTGFAPVGNADADAALPATVVPASPMPMPMPTVDGAGATAPAAGTNGAAREALADPAAVRQLSGATQAGSGGTAATTAAGSAILTAAETGTRDRSGEQAAPAPASVSSPAAGDGAARPGEATALLDLVKTGFAPVGNADADAALPATVVPALPMPTADGADATAPAAGTNGAEREALADPATVRQLSGATQAGSGGTVVTTAAGSAILTAAETGMRDRSGEQAAPASASLAADADPRASGRFALQAPASAVAPVATVQAASGTVGAKAADAPAIVPVSDAPIVEASAASAAPPAKKGAVTLPDDGNGAASVSGQAGRTAQETGRAGRNEKSGQVEKTGGATVSPSLAALSAADAGGATGAAGADPAAQGASLATVATGAAAGPSTGAAAGVSVGATLDRQIVDMGVSGQWIDDIARQIASVGANPGQGRFQIASPTLGAVRVELTPGAQGTDVRLSAETEAAQVALSKDQGRLVQDAQLAAVRIGEVRIDRFAPVAESQRSDMGGNENKGGNAGAQPGAQAALGQNAGQGGQSGSRQEAAFAGQNFGGNNPKTPFTRAVLRDAGVAESTTSLRGGGADRARYA